MQTEDYMSEYKYRTNTKVTRLTISRPLPPIYFFFRQVLLTYWKKTSLSERDLQHRLSYIW